MRRIAADLLLDDVTIRIGCSCSNQLPAAAILCGITGIQFRVGSADSQCVQGLAGTIYALTIIGTITFLVYYGTTTFRTALDASQTTWPIEIGADLTGPFLAVSYIALASLLLLLLMLLLWLRLGKARGRGLDGQTSCRLLRTVVVFVYGCCCLRWTETETQKGGNYKCMYIFFFDGTSLTGIYPRSAAAWTPGTWCILRRMDSSHRCIFHISISAPCRLHRTSFARRTSDLRYL